MLARYCEDRQNTIVTVRLKTSAKCSSRQGNGSNVLEENMTDILMHSIKRQKHAFVNIQYIYIYYIYIYIYIYIYMTLHFTHLHNTLLHITFLP